MRSLLLILLIFIVSCNSAKDDKPNVVLFVVDDLGWTDLSSYGSDLYQTPNVDKLAKNGMLFTDAYATCTVCSPSRASIMTGKYPARINCTDWISGHKKPFAKLKIPEWTQYMAQEETTLAEVFQKAGYKTIHIGKWHLGKEDKYWPEFQGFDINVGGWSMGSPQKRNGGNGYFPPYLNPRLSDGPEGEYLTERLGDAALEFIEENKHGKAPFFMNFWFYNVHTPLQAKEDKIEKYEKQVKQSANHQNPVYAAMVEHMDDAVGKVLKKLEESGMLENTIVIFTSDNGCSPAAKIDEMEEKGHKPSYIYRGHKADIYEGGHRVPFIVKWPAKIQETSISNHTICTTDLMATLADIIGYSLKDNEGEDSYSMLSLFEQNGINKSKRKTTVHHSINGNFAIRKEKWKLIMAPGSGGWSFPNPDKDKEILDTMPPVQLYDLETDPGEKYNLQAKNPEIVAELKTLLIKYILDGRSTPGKPQQNDSIDFEWKQIEFIKAVSHSD